MNLTTLARVKARAGIALASDTYDALLTDFIAEVSKQVSDALRRDVEAKERTVKVAMYFDTRTIPLPAYPVASVTALRNASKPVFTDLEPWTANEDYILDEDAGELQILTEPEWNLDEGGYPRGPTWFQVVYVGGMAATTELFVANWADLAGGVDEQCRYLYQRKDSLGGNSKTSNGETTFTGPYDLLPSLQARITHHARGL